MKMRSRRRGCGRFGVGLLAAAVVAVCSGCGPVQMPRGGFTKADDLLAAFDRRLTQIQTVRITGRVDHFGEKHRVQGKIFIFGELPGRLRMELVSPFGSPLTVLTVSQGRFELHDLREGRFLEGPAEPCNIARLVRIPLPPGDVARILVGHTPIVEGTSDISWSPEGHYVVEIEKDDVHQTLKIGTREQGLPLHGSIVRDERGTLFSIANSRFSAVDGVAIPHEIRVKMPREDADLLLRYDNGGVELGVDLPKDAWHQRVPSGMEVERVTCE